MLEFFIAGPNLAFAVVLALLLVFFVIELAGLLIGTSLTGLLGDLDLPDLDLDLGVDHDLDLGACTKFLCWLKIGKIPLMVLIVIFMGVFVVSGYAIQFLSVQIGGRMLPGLLATAIALIVAVPVVRLCGRFLSKIIPRDESDAISHDALVGGRAVVVLGMARKDSPAQARTTDRHGTIHYLMVEPDNPEDTLQAGAELLLVRKTGNLFFAVPHPQPAGLDIEDGER